MSWRRWITSSAVAVNCRSGISLYDVVSQNSRGAGALNAPTASAGLDNLDQSFAVSNTLTLSPTTVNETRVQMVTSDLQCAAERSDRAGGQHRRRCVVRHAVWSPHARTNTMFQVVNNLSHNAGAHALRVGADFIYNDDTITYPRAVRGSYAFSSMANFLAGRYNASGFTQTFGDSVVSQTNPNLGVYVQDEWKAGPALTVNAGLRYDLQFLRTIDDRHEQRLAAAGLRLDADRLAPNRRARQRRSVLRSRAASGARQCVAIGRQYDRFEPASADRHQPVSGAGRARPCFRTFSPLPFRPSRSSI